MGPYAPYEHRSAQPCLSPAFGSTRSACFGLVSGPIRLFVPATLETLDEIGYLYANPDLAEAAGNPPDPDFASRHFEALGIREDRLQLATDVLQALQDSRATKLARLFDRSPGTHARVADFPFEVCGLPMLSIVSRADDRLPVPYERISSHEYDDEVSGWVDSDSDGLFLDLGAGLRRVYRPNVVFAEIASLPSTDVLCFGDRLPFDAETFDGVICLSVLEHVPDPFAVAAEIMRVLRPGGRAVVDWPFLQPVHGYPHHYLNATSEGAREVFQRLPSVAEVGTTVPPWLHPVFTLRWFLDEWQAGLPEEERTEFLRLSVADILGSDSVTLLGQVWAQSLKADHQPIIAAGTRLTVTKLP